MTRQRCKRYRATTSLRVEICHDARDGHAAREYASLRRVAYSRHRVLTAEQVSGACSASRRCLVLVRYPDRTLAAALSVHDRRLGALPVERAVSRYRTAARTLCRILERLGEVVELSGTVVSPRARGIGASELVVRAGVAALGLLDCRAAIGFGHQHVLPLYRRFGFIPVRRLGCHAYPDARYRSRIAVLRDVRRLLSVSLHERRRILQLRKQLSKSQSIDRRHNHE